MRAEYKRDMNHNYLVLQGDIPVDTSSYQVRMLAGNEIPLLLKCRMQGLDGKLLFYYEITSKQSLADLFENKKLRIADLQAVFGGFVHVMEEMAEYLLNPGQLVLRPEYMYMDVEKQELFFCYLPGFEKEVKEQFQCLTEYILPKLDHEDSQAVMLGYGIYRRALEDCFHLEYIKEELYQMKGEAREPAAIKAPEKETEASSLTEEAIRQEDLWSFKEIPEKEGVQQKETEQEETREKRAGLRKIVPGCFCGAAMVFAILAAELGGWIPWLRIEWMAGGILALAGCGMMIYFFVERRRKAENEEKVQDYIKKRETVTADNTSMAAKAAESHAYESPGISEAAQPLNQQENFGETVVLSASPIAGPASLVSREPGELATIYLLEELTIIGKLGNASDAVIDLPTVSRVHAKIRKREEEYYLTDLNSRNGTSVNGQMLKGDEEYLLQNEDEVDFAQARYIFLK